ncbi:aromatic ring-hydroxylating dioxygenase subunit alpha [filamentous cyanobacterium LEGE 11480]|uniref:Aromatic ring-hydroxylating dioxygenase subunit alpha n=1 Tax=Romeriopsis navalis LEGE 11480 TaxID=2777977 RepID=A0A928Z152_9CYAN|nr:aromatic ring-hydroxylating dioxygenase subunit alpha [Romeriopsis navalis]MBE9028144.1 aromatic ring-hydroxylating dioxygenase subunit alpha [Romeriopsis navalis LEGE 11480]
MQYQSEKSPAGTPVRSSGANATATAVSQLQQIHQAICDTAARPLELAIAMNAGAYTNQEFYDWEVEHILKTQWLCVGHVSQVPNIGDYVNFDLLEEPMMMVRNHDQQVQVLSRICPHRAMDLMPPDFGAPTTGNRKSFLCPYHRWSFGLEGQMLGAPEMQNSPLCQTEGVKLHTFRTELWEGFVFVTFDPDLEPIATHYAGLTPHLKRWHMDELEVVADIQWDCQFNWKVLVENFMEGYHHMGSHHKTLEPMLPASGTWTEPETPNYIVCHLPLAKHLIDKFESGESLNTFIPSPDLLKSDNHEYTVYLGEPYFLLFIGADRVYWYFLQPEGPGKMTLRTMLLVRPESREIPEFETKLNREIDALKEFHLEDMEMCTSVQRGLNSTAYQPGPLSHLEMPIWQFHRYLARQVAKHTD